MSVFKGQKSIIELTPSNFKTNKTITHPLLSNSKKGIVSFTCSWCGHCRNMVKSYSEAADACGGSFLFFNVDCVKYPELSNKLDIQGYPTIKYIDKNGKMYKDFAGERSRDSLLGGVCKESRVCM